MNNKERILLTLDFTGANYPSALYAMQQWSQYASQGQKYDILLGPTTSGHRSSPIGAGLSLTGEKALTIIAQYKPKRMNIVRWDGDVDQIALGILKQNKISSQPFYTDFSYGGAVNRRLLLANEMSCNYIVRIDPGTRPPEEPPFDNLVELHINAIKQSPRDIVISLGYKDRLAIRDIFLIDEKAKEEQYKLIQKMTKINPQKQVTGGAMFTSPVPGTPAIPFQKSDKGLTSVWGSDDAIFQLLPETEGSEKLTTTEIPRFDAVGKPKTTIDYYRGVAGMVVLSSLLRGNSQKDAAEQIDEFVPELMELLDKEKCRANDKYNNWQDWQASFTRQNIAPVEFIQQIADGLQNYRCLLKEWKDICNILKGKLSSSVQII